MNPIIMNNMKNFIIVVFLLASYLGLSQDMNFYWAQQYGSDDFASDIEAVTVSKLNKVIAFTHFEAIFYFFLQKSSQSPHHLHPPTKMLYCAYFLDALYLFWLLRSNRRGN